MGSSYDDALAMGISGVPTSGRAVRGDADNGHRGAQRDGITLAGLPLTLKHLQH